MAFLTFSYRTSSDLQGSLQCYLRWNNETVPGCLGEDYSKADYCCDRPDNYLFIVGNDGNPAGKFPLDACEGDCDDDDECKGALVCQQRSGYTEVPGCEGIGKRGNDYCRYPTSDYEYINIGTCETGADKWQGPASSADKSNLAVSFFVFGDTPYDHDCSTCNTCIGEDGNKEEDCSRYDCILKTTSMSELPVNNTCTYEGREYDCVKNGIIPYVNSKIVSEDAAFVAHVGDILSECEYGMVLHNSPSLHHILIHFVSTSEGNITGTGNRRCTKSSFASRRDLFNNATNFLIVPGDNDWNECYGYNVSSNTDPVREMWRDHFANMNSPFDQFSQDFPGIVGGGRPTIERQLTNPENFYFEYNSVAFFGLNSVVGSSYVKDIAPEDLNAVWVEQILNMSTCTIKSLVLMTHVEPSSDVDAKLNNYFNRCGSPLPTLFVHGNSHPKTYCMTKTGLTLTITVEAFQSSPLLVSIVRDPAGGDYFHVYDPDPSDSNENCPSLQSTTPSPIAPPTPKPTYAPNTFGATYVPGDLQVSCDDGNLTLSKGMNCKLLTTENQPIQYANGTSSQEVMHARADGAGVIPHIDGGWYLVSNSEVGAGRGGVGTLRFDAAGEVIGYERTLTGTSRNCGGGDFSVPDNLRFHVRSASLLIF